MSSGSDYSTVRVVPAGDRPQRQEHGCLVVIVGQGVGRKYPIGAHLEIGRGAESPIEIIDSGVSRRHAMIVRDRDGHYSIRDLGSRNGTYVNGKRVAESGLEFGDKIGIGAQSVFLFESEDRLEDQRVQAQKLLALGQLAGGVAHDFNNLLNVVLANVTYLRTTPSEDKAVVAEVLEEIETAARRAVDLTHQLLAFARSGRVDDKVTDVGQLLADAERLLRRTLHRSITLVASADEGLIVAGDSSQLMQVLMNLAINAGDAMPGGGRLELEATLRSIDAQSSAVAEVKGPGQFVRVRVRDEGVGMSEEVRSRIFEPFFTTKPKGKGTGLGLATAHAIIREHGGTIRVESEIGRGTGFEILLPLADATADPASKPMTEALGSAVGVVLLADDEELVRNVAARVLRHAGLEVLCACDGAEAVTMYEADPKRIDCIVLDLDMPRLNGEQVHAQLREKYPHVRVLISSGYLDHEREASLRKAGVDGILYKPYDSSALLSAVKDLLKPAASNANPT